MDEWQSVHQRPNSARTQARGDAIEKLFVSYHPDDAKGTVYDYGAVEATRDDGLHDFGKRRFGMDGWNITPNDSGEWYIA